MKSRRAANDQDYETWILGGVAPTLNAFDNATDTRAVILIPMTAWSVREDAKANTFSATPLTVTNALQAHQPSVQSHHAQTFITQEIEVEAIPLDLRNAGRDPEKHDEMNRQGVVTTIVRRLTPTECERLQGFPDGWTVQRIDHKTGQLVQQKDSARYKQMGNAVAVPCVQWILARIMEGTQ